MAENSNEIRALEMALPLICTDETTQDQAGWTKENPLWGHCAVVALLAQDLFGGELLRASLDGTPFTSVRSHYWNRLPNGIEVDFTNPQFGDNPPVGLQAETRTREYLLSNPNTRSRYEILKKRFKDHRPQ